MNRLTVGIDWNNTIQDQIGELVARSGYKLSRQDFAVWDDPSGAAKLGITEEEFIAWCWKNEAIQEMAQPFAGVKEAIDRMKAKGWKIKIITHSTLAISKIMAWFDKYNIPFDEIVKAKDKSQVYWDILIDDNPIVLQQMIDKHLPVIKFALQWNYDINTHSFSDWRSL